MQWYDPEASETQVPLFWQGDARQGAHFDNRLISTGPERDNGNRRGGGEWRDDDEKTGREQRKDIFSHTVLKGTPKDIINGWLHWMVC